MNTTQEAQQQLRAAQVRIREHESGGLRVRVANASDGVWDIGQLMKHEPLAPAQDEATTLAKQMLTMTDLYNDLKEKMRVETDVFERKKIETDTAEQGLK